MSISSVMIAVSALLAACASPTPQIVEKIVEKQVQVTQQVVVTKEVIKEVEKSVNVVVTATPAPVKAAEKFDLRIGNVCGDFSAPAYNLMLAGFASSHPNVTVKKECITGDYAAQIYTLAAAGNLPDVFFGADLFTVPFVAAKTVQDMRPFAKKEGNPVFDDIFPNIMALGQVPGDDSVYMVPSSLDTVQMYYNVDLFTKSGVDLPKDDWTWDQWITACKTIIAKNPGIYCVNPGLWWATWVPWIVGYGGDVLSPDGRKSTLASAESIAGLTAFGELWTKHKIAVPPGTTEGGDALFLAQKSVTLFHIPVFMKAFREKATFKWDVALMAAQPKKQVTGMGTFGYSISAQSKHPQEAWDFVKSLVSPAGQRIQLTGYTAMPLLKSMANDPGFSELTAPPANFKAFVKGGEIGIFPRRDFPAKCGSMYAGLVNQTHNAMLEAIQRGTGTASEEAKKADSIIQKCLDENAK